MDLPDGAFEVAGPPAPATFEEREAAFEKLLMTVVSVDLVAILIIYVIPVFFLGWGVVMVFPLIGILVFTTMYFVYGLRKLWAP
jgi:hypothetical protein